MVLLENISYVQAEQELRKQEVVIIPIGSTEQHGPQCPLGTDFIIPTTLAHEASKRENVVCLPTIPFGVASHHRNFSGTIFISEDIFKHYISDVIASLLYHDCKKILLVNGHGGNSAALMSVMGEIRREFPDIAILLYEYWKQDGVAKRVYGPNASMTHADGIETSLVHICRPGTVDMDLASTLEIPSTWGIPIAGLIMPGTTDEFSELGPVGDMSTLSEEKAIVFKDALIDQLCHIIKELNNFSF
jgi:creatinine amidohydrolase